MPRSSRSTALPAGFLVALVATAGPALASGIASIRQSDGSTSTYPKASIRAEGPTDLRIGSPDRRDVLIVASSGCAAVDGVLTCRPTSARLLRSGRTYPLTLRSGSEFFNASATSHGVANASVPAHGVVLHLMTMKGTTIDVRGTIDGGARA